MPSPPAPRRRPPALAALAACALASCVADRTVDVDDPACEAALKGADAVDAFAWFKDPYGGPKRLGDWTNDQGLAFAHQLEIRGAKRVVAVGVTRATGADGHERARGLVVELPGEPDKRLAVFRACAGALRDRGYSPRADRGQKFLYLPFTS